METLRNSVLKKVKKVRLCSLNAAGFVSLGGGMAVVVVVVVAEVGAVMAVASAVPLVGAAKVVGGTGNAGVLVVGTSSSEEDSLCLVLVESLSLLIL